MQTVKQKTIDVLLAEDNPDDIFLTRLAINESFPNHKLTVINDGKEIIKIINERLKENVNLPDLIFLDINLPRVNGIDVLKEIKSNESTKLIPTVMFTSSDSKYDMNLCYEIGADLYLHKPNNIADFIKLISYARNHLFYS